MEGTMKAEGYGDIESMEDIEAENPSTAAASLKNIQDTLNTAGDGDPKSVQNIEAENPGTAATGLGNIEDIFKAAVVGDLESLKNIDAKDPGTVAASRDWQRRTVLHLAAGEGHTEVCGYLIASLKVFVDTRDMHGETPLFKATGQAHVDTVKFLLLKGANHNSKSKMGVTPLHKAASLGNLELVELLIAKDKELKSQSNMGIPLEFAVKSGSIDCFKALIEAGAAPEAITLHAAAESGSVEIVDWFLKARRDPNACNSKGLKPIEVAAHCNNLAVVKLLFPWTTPFLDVLNWSVQGVMENGLLKDERKGMDHVSEEEAAPERSPFVQMGRDASDKEIDQKLKEMLLPDEYNFFHGWSPMKKRLFYESVFVQPTSLEKVLDDGIAEIKNSVICDLTNKDRAQSSYLRAVHHYQAWHFSGSDLIYEIGPHRKRFCVSRKDQTFVFWFRYLEQDVGLVIDGQALWVEGMLRRTRGKDGRYTYASPIQFRDARRDSSSSSSKQKASTYIVHRELIEADYGGTYAGFVSNMKFSIDTTRSAVVAVGAHDKQKSLDVDCHAACDNLIFFATEAGKNSWVFEYTMHSLDPKLEHPITVPFSFNGTVTSHQQVSEKLLSALEAISEKKLEHVPRGGYEIVPGTVFRTTWQCVSAYIILRRQKPFKTKFFLKGSEKEYRKQRRMKPKRERHESDQQYEERLHEENVKTGTLFDPMLHGGMRHRLSKGPKPLNPSRNRWYHVDEPRYVYKE